MIHGDRLPDGIPAPALDPLAQPYGPAVTMARQRNHGRPVLVTGRPVGSHRRPYNRLILAETFGYRAAVAAMWQPTTDSQRCRAAGTAA
jgi:hypothetical protein